MSPNRFGGRACFLLAVCMAAMVGRHAYGDYHLWHHDVQLVGSLEYVPMWYRDPMAAANDALVQARALDSENALLRFYGRWWKYPAVPLPSYCTFDGAGELEGEDFEQACSIIRSDYVRRRAASLSEEFLGFDVSRLDALYVDNFKEEAWVFVGRHSGDGVRIGGSDDCSTWGAKTVQDKAKCTWVYEAESLVSEYPESPEGAARQFLWSRHGWFAMNAPTKFRSGGTVTRTQLFLRVGRIDERDGDDHVEANPVLLCGTDRTGQPYAERPSVTRSGTKRRHFAIYAISRNEARLVFQVGVSPDDTVNDSLAVLDLCYDARARQYIRCEDGAPSRSVQDVCPEVHPDNIEGTELQGLQIGPNPRLLPNGRGWEGHPSFSPDGKWLAYLRFDGVTITGTDAGTVTRLATDESEKRNLWILANRGNVDDLLHPGNALNLTNEFDHSILQYRWSCGGRCILVMVSKEGLTPIYQIDLEERHNANPRLSDTADWQRLSVDSAIVFDPTSGGGDPKQPPEFRMVKSFAVSPTGLTLYPVVTSIESPSERVYRCRRLRADAGSPFDGPTDPCEPVTPGEGSSGIVVRDLGRYRICRDTGSTGGDANQCADELPPDVPQLGRRYVPGHVVFPPGFFGLADAVSIQASGEARTIPLLIYIHGGPHGVSRPGFRFLQHHLVRGAKGGAEPFVFVAPNIAGSSSYGETYRKSVRDDWGGQAYRDIARTIEYWAGQEFAGLDDDTLAPGEKDALWKIDPGRIYLLGESYGGYLINYIITGGGDRPIETKSVVDGQVKRTPVAIKGAFPFFGPFDLKNFPCRTDQKWFAEQQFGYHKRDDGSCVPKGHRPEFDPKVLLKRAIAKLENKSPSSERAYAVREAPILVFHGNDDKRVTLGESQAFAFGFRMYNETLGASPVPFSACEVPGREHGFDIVTQLDVYAAISAWVECDGDPECFDSGTSKVLEIARCGTATREEWERVGESLF